MRIVEKETEIIYDIYDITYDKNGYPQFLIFKDGQWIRRSAKYFKPEREKLINLPKFVVKGEEDTVQLLHS